MSKKNAKKSGDQGVSKVKLAVGAASLFLFIIGVKRTFKMEQPDVAEERRRSAAKSGADQGA